MQKIFFSTVLVYICCVCSVFSQNTISDMKVETIENETRFIIFTNGFGGDCTTQLAIDSVKESCYYISGKYDSNCKCYGTYKSDTISLGKLQNGEEYEIIFSLIDIFESVSVLMDTQPTEIYEKKFIVEQSTGIKKVNACGSIIKNNPVKDFLTLTLPTDNNEIKIFDLQGKLLLQQNVGFSATINVSMLPMGTYVLVVNGESYKFVKE